MLGQTVFPACPRQLCPNPVTYIIQPNDDDRVLVFPGEMGVQALEEVVHGALCNA